MSCAECLFLYTINRKLIAYISIIDYFQYPYIVKNINVYSPMEIISKNGQFLELAQHHIIGP